MSAARRRSGGWQVLVSAEDATDREAIKALLRGLRPDLSAELENLRTPITLVKGMRPEAAKSRNSKIVAAIRAANARTPVRATLLHEDADAVEPAHVTLIASKEAGVAAAPGVAVAVVPAWEIETWWLLFPAAVHAVRPSWRVPDKYVGRDVGHVRHSKEELIALLRPSQKGHRVPDYATSDAPEVAARIVAMGLLGSPAGHSGSWACFVAKALAI